MTKAAIKTDDKNLENEIVFRAAITTPEWSQAMKFQTSLKRRGKKDIKEWDNIGMIQTVLEAKSIELSATSKPNNKEIGAFNRKHFPAINPSALSYAKRFHQNFKEIMAYRKAEKLTGTNNPVVLVQGWVKYQAAQKRAAAALALEAELEAMPEEERKEAEKMLKTEKRSKAAQKKLNKFLDMVEDMGSLVAESAYNADDLKRLNKALASLDDAMAEQLKVKAAA